MKHLRPIFLFIICFCSTIYLNAQDNSELLLGAEMGTDIHVSETPENNLIRGSTIYYAGSESQHISSLFHTSYYGVKAELLTSNLKFGIASGLRFRITDSEIKRGGFFNMLPNYFLLLMEQSGTTTEYMRVENITQTNYYLGVPLEFRYFPYYHRKIRLYIKATVDVAYRLDSKEKVNFVNEEMNIYQDEVLQLFGSASDFYSSFNLSAGWIYGSKDHPKVSLEAIFPSLILTQAPSILNQPLYGFGVQLNFSYPL